VTATGIIKRGRTWAILVLFCSRQDDSRFAFVLRACGACRTCCLDVVGSNVLFSKKEKGPHFGDPFVLPDT